MFNPIETVSQVSGWGTNVMKTVLNKLVDFGVGGILDLGGNCDVFYREKPQCSSSISVPLKFMNRPPMKLVDIVSSRMCFSNIVLASSTAVKDADDDECFEPLNKQEFNLGSTTTLPIPDPTYVIAHTPSEMHPFIAHSYKKDCRTWLWKSANQRRAKLAQQEQEKKNRSPDS